MPIRQLSRLCVHGLVSLLLAATAVAQQPAADSPALASMKKDAIAGVESRTKLAQVMVDTVFSYSELGYQEFHSSKYLSDLLESNGFKVERGIAGIPTAFMATWGSGKPVIASHVGGLQALIRDGATGLFFDPNAADAAAVLAARLSTLAGSAELRLNLGQAGRQEALARYDWAKIGQQLETLYQRAEEHCARRS